MQIKTVYCDETLRIGTVGSLLDHHYAQLLKEHSQISVLSVLKFETVNRVRSGSKASAIALVQKYQHGLRAQATVVAMQGIAGSLIRTFMVGFNLMTRSNCPTKVFGTVEEGIAWLKTSSDDFAMFSQTYGATGAG
jgi:hypothetical protein